MGRETHGRGRAADEILPEGEVWDKSASRQLEGNALTQPMRKTIQRSGVAKQQKGKIFHHFQLEIKQKNNIPGN